MKRYIKLQKDATIYSSDYDSILNTVEGRANKNYGLDEITELFNIPVNPSVTASAKLLWRVKDADLELFSTPFTASLVLYSADADYEGNGVTIKAYPVTAEWDNGSGTYELPASVGVTWNNAKSGSAWSTPGGDTSNAYTSSVFIDWSSENDGWDVTLNITNMITAWKNNSISNNGGLLTLSSGNGYLKFFSNDSNTIYKPRVLIEYDDYVYNPNTGSAASVETETDISFSLKNLQSVYTKGPTVRIYANIRPRVTNALFTSGSAYTNNYYLTSASKIQWRLVDAKDKTVLFDWNNNTRLSISGTQYYFDFCTDDLAEERMYQFQAKITKADGTVFIYNKLPSFKITK